MNNNLYIKQLFNILLFTFSLNLHATPSGVVKLTSLSFSVKTNMPGVEFQGKLIDEISFIDESKDNLKKLVIPLKALSTEIELRDNHMREKIFKGQDPSFEGKLKCDDKNEKCVLDGTLTISGVSKNLSLKVDKDSDHFRLEHNLLLSDYQIPIPEFMGIGVQNEIHIIAHFK